MEPKTSTSPIQQSPRVEAREAHTGKSDDGPDYGVCGSLVLFPTFPWDGPE